MGMGRLRLALQFIFKLFTGILIVLIRLLAPPPSPFAFVNDLVHYSVQHYMYFYLSLWLP